MSFPSPLTTLVRNPRLRLLEALRAGSKPVMTFLGLPSFRTAQLVAATGLDGIIVDCEHGHISDDAMHASVSAIAAQGVSPLVRLRMAHPDLIKRALDAGAHGIVVPMVHTADDARAVVEHAKFPPHGIRGQGSAFPGFAYGTDIATYIKTANQTLLTCVQIESRLGVENVDSICAVPGIDMVFIGPNDLSLAILGYVPAQGSEPEFVAAIDQVVAAARKHGKWIGRLSNNAIAAKQHLEVFDTVALGYDVRALQSWYTAELQAIRS
ncbi:2,4-dihydroxyhept-2-ene-1,7-dioic acid aldolase [Microdochium trichocladiopsis]|uniref:2,4-dihydroxyhept-2-ene-1,7-dioic acid aldolase n=1 Tax=Microdochium trichocladiopsis TaxID=1682393 RepID=A0A9P9BLB6_9PEZI|nr:2,4-dihydroxyhept-2-ene-1,7-dioic acid aldolase [Microdochium trichocladiopsis]KAH7012624.1 2,4-dihydroxyhept-2-ene-1,7-dioic acid aldolase [Microdochium trichocladiopsis]